MKYQQHPLSSAFPAMQDDEYQTLKDSVLNIGVQNPITIFEGMVLDGWNRYSAAGEFGMDCPEVMLGDIDPVEFVKSQNLHRRHLTESQRTAAIVACSIWRPSHREKKVELGSTLSKTNKQIADEAGVSTRTVTDVKAAQRAGIIDAVRDGALTAKEAGIIARGAEPKAKSPKAETVTTLEPQHEDAYTPLDAAHDQIEELQTALSVACMGNASEEEKEAAKGLIDGLRAEIKTLTASLKAAYYSRDSLMEENAQLKRQCQMQRKEIEKLKSGK